VADVCRRLEGLPLAIELAAARIRLLEPDVLLAKLANRLDALGSGPVDLPERQRTLRATVDWSVGLLDQVERHMLFVLAAFVDGWTIEAAAHVRGITEDRTLDLIDALARHSLVHVGATDDGPRFRMLETVRAFAAEQLAADPDLAEVERQHAGYFQGLVERADRPLRGLGQTEWAERLQQEKGNLRAAIRWFLAHDVAPLPHLFRVLWLFWWLRDNLVEGWAWIEELMPRVATLNDHAQAEFAWAAAVTALEVGEDAAALAAIGRMKRLVARIGDPYLGGVSQLATAWVLPSVGDFDGALRAASVCLQHFRNQEEPFMTALAVVTLGFLETAVGRHDEALRHLTEVRALGEQFDNDWLNAGSRVQLGTLAVMQGRLDEARSLLDEGLTLSVAAESTHGVTFCLVALARLALAEGSPERAAVALGAAEGLRRRAGLRVWPTVRQGEAELLGQVEQALGPDRFRETFAAGAGLSRRDAVATVRSSGGFDAHTS
jgi:tetratricopeptide (TPR) repeat protein